MYIIPRYLYDDMTFQEYTGVRNTLVDTEVVPLKLNLPKVTWHLSLDYATLELKNAIELALHQHADDLYVETVIGPAYYIDKRVDNLGDTHYYMTYLFEENYYGKPVSRPLVYSTSGSDHILADGTVIPSSQSESSPPVTINSTREVPRKVLFADSSLNIVHKANGLYSIKIKLEDIAKPMGYTDIYRVGVPDADYIANC
jgi:hypothetical protein